jgi:leucyl-tRNA---protein transferase
MQIDADLKIINEEFYAESVTPAQLDMLLASGWRHFGTQFFRYNIALYRDEIRRVMPLRIRLADFRLSKSQRRILRRNEDLNVVIRPAAVTPESEDLFHRHKQRFDHNLPSTIYSFLSREPARVPCECRELALLYDKTLIGVGYFDLGQISSSGVYTSFDPLESKRSLGIFTILKEIEFAIDSGREFYYPGYVYQGESFYDYKKQLSAGEIFDWMGNWIDSRTVNSI